MEGWGKKTGENVHGEKQSDMRTRQGRGKRLRVRGAKRDTKQRRVEGRDRTRQSERERRREGERERTRQRERWRVGERRERERERWGREVGRYLSSLLGRTLQKLLLTCHLYLPVPLPTHLFLCLYRTSLHRQQLLHGQKLCHPA